MGAFNPLGATWLQSLELKPEERVITAWDGDHETTTVERVARTKVVQKGLISKHNEAVATGKYDNVTDKHTDSGALVLTSKRLIWFERRGTLSKAMSPTIYIDLLELGGITKGGKLAYFR